MLVIPAIDLLGDDAVRLRRGRYERVLFRRDAVAYTAELVERDPPLLHVVDLDGARSGAIRYDVIRPVLEAAGAIPVQAAGGIRDLETATRVLGMGASRVVIGTAAFGELAVLDELVDQLGERLVVAIDSSDGLVATSGWLQQTGVSVAEAAARCLDAGVARVLGTAIVRDGTLRGPDLVLTRRLCGSGLRVLAAGGIRGADDLALLEDAGCEGAVVGRAFAERSWALGVTAAG